jgi:hypothetical protein
MSQAPPDVTPLWAIVANMTGQPRNGREPDSVYTGTPMFSAGTKLHLGKVYWGMVERAHFIGKPRNAARWVSCAIDMDLVVNVRPN